MIIYLQHIDWRVVLLALLGYYLPPPLAAGYFAARFARRLPLMTSAALAVAGCLLTAYSLSVSVQVFTGYMALCMALALLGVYQERKRQRCN